MRTDPLTPPHPSHPPQRRHAPTTPGGGGGALSPDGLLRGLTPAQAAAVSHTEGPLLVLAGPGSGKTRVITHRIAYLLGCGIPPWQVLALTFTNKAAREMRERVTAILGEDLASRGLTVTTFHSLCARLLRRFADVARIPGLTPTFTIYDDADQLALMKRVIQDANLSASNWTPRSVLSRISAAKNELKGSEAMAAEAHDFQSRHISRLYAAYERALRIANAVDFDDLLVLTVRMLRGSPEALAACRDRWRYLLIDEYQDTNGAQLQIAMLLAGEGEPGDAAGAGGGGGGGGPNICVVGDPDQSIYGWRGADIRNILDFEAHYPGAKVVPLGENFRSTASIVAAADALIRHNSKRKHKDLSSKRGEGRKVELVLCRDEHHEAELVIDWMRHVRETGDFGWKDMAVLYRTNALSRVVEDAMRAAGVPYVIARGTAFYQREEIKHALAYLRVVANPSDDASLARIVNTPSRGIGDTTVRRIEQAAAGWGVPLIEGLRRAKQVPGVSTRALSAILAFLDLLDSWSGAGTFMGEDVPGSLRELVDRVVSESTLKRHYQLAGTDADMERIENLDELVSSAADFENAYDAAEDPAAEFGPGGGQAAGASESPALLALLRAYLERITLVADADAVDPAQGSVTLMTLHAAKGLEFRACAMIGLEENVLPHTRAQESEADLEEERRLCYVGITRAMDRLLVLAARRRTFRGVSERTIPSRFLGELPREHVTASDQSDSYDEDGEFGGLGSDGGGTESRRGAGGAGGAGAAGSGRGMRVGAIVRHPQFGVGRVESLSGGSNARAQVRFRGAGVKTLILEYARLTVVDPGDLND